MANALQTYTNGTDVVAEIYEYDLFGNRVSTTDAFGNTVHRSYDPFVNVLSKWGAAYPVRNEYDTAGRRILLATTRDGIVWDVTRWTYDAATGLCTSKTYADGSVVRYTYTPDGLPLRTTYASGRWIENLYDARRQLVGTLSSDGENDSAMQRDAYGRETSVSNGIASYAYALDCGGIATNETTTIGGIARTLRRTVDAQGRLASFGMDGGYVPQTISYRADERIGSISNADVVVTYSYSDDGYDIGYTLAVAGGMTLTRTLTRDPCRRELVLNVANSTGGDFAYTYDALSRPVTRNGDVFGYNARSEVVDAVIDSNHEEHSYDGIGNSIFATYNGVTNTYAANNLNQYSSITTLRASVSPRETNPSYDTDGNLLSFGPWSYSYDSANRLTTVSSNGVLLVMNFYDAKSRRVRKVTPEATTTFFYDGWNLVEEYVAYTNGTTSTIRYHWGKDLSGTLQGAGGVGGLLYLTLDGSIFVPLYDAYGNVMEYRAVDGSLAAGYVYDSFGRTISQTGSHADIFRFRYSTKSYEGEAGLYCFGERFYSPNLRTWMTRDLIEEDGGLNLYSFCLNNPICRIDADGCMSVGSIILDNLGYDKSKPLLGPFGIPIGTTGARFQIHVFISGELFYCCQQDGKKLFARITLGLEPYVVWGKGRSRSVKGRDRNKPDKYRTGKQKDYSTDPQDSGYRSRSWHVGKNSQNESCPESGLQISNISGSIFLRGSLGVGIGAQFNVQKDVDATTDITSGWSLSGDFSAGVWGATIEVGGNVHATATYGPL